MQVVAELGRSGAFLLQGLVALLMALSVSAVWYAFRRRPMALWAWTWWVLTAAVLTSALAATGGRKGKLAVSLLGLGLWFAVAPMAEAAAQAVVGRVLSWPRFVQRAVLVGAGGVALAFGLTSAIGFLLPLDQLALGSVVVTHGPVIIVLLAAGVRVLQTSRANPAIAGLAVIGISLVLLAGRTTLWVMPGAIGATPESRAVLLAAASTLQLVTIVVFGVGTLLALLSEERRAALAREHELNRADRMDSLGQMAGGIAHDFNNVLTAVVAGIDLARHDAAGQPRLDQDLAEAQRAADRGRALVSQLLRYARRESARPVVTELAGQVADLCRMLEYLLGSRFELIYQQPAGSFRARIDVPRYEQSIINLVVNARDAMRDGGRIVIGIGARDLKAPSLIGDTHLPAGSYVVTSVEDTGSGIGAADLSRIFAPFYTDKPEGTGLGLANVRAAAIDAGGAVTVSSQVGCGTRFEIWLPVDGVPTTPRPPRPSLAATNQGP